MKIILAITALLFSANCFALTGNELHAWITSENAYTKIEGESYIMGVMDTIGVHRTIEISLAARKKRKPNLDLIICPDNVIYRQGYDLVKNYLTNHPETRNQQASVLVYKALSEAWPCPAQ